jgi:hypothetical protein
MLLLPRWFARRFVPALRVATDRMREYFPSEHPSWQGKTRDLSAERQSALELLLTKYKSFHDVWIFLLSSSTIIEHEIRYEPFKQHHTEFVGLPLRNSLPLCALTNRAEGVARILDARCLSDLLSAIEGVTIAAVADFEMMLKEGNNSM